MKTKNYNIKPHFYEINETKPTFSFIKMYLKVNKTINKFKSSI